MPWLCASVYVCDVRVCVFCVCSVIIMCLATSALCGTRLASWRVGNMQVRKQESARRDATKRLKKVVTRWRRNDMLGGLPLIGQYLPKIPPSGREIPQWQIEQEILAGLSDIPDLRITKLNDRGQRDIEFNFLSISINFLFSYCNSLYKVLFSYNSSDLLFYNF